MTPTETFTVTTTQDPLESLELHDVASKSRLVLAPARGGMATRLTLNGRDLLYLDEATLRDETKNVRGGNPVLFPSPGKLEGDAYAWKETRGNLKQHGFARNSIWEVVKTSDTNGASATLRLDSNEQTRRDFPWDFRAEYTYLLRGDSLRIDMTFTSTGAETSAGKLPFGAGFHPYFSVLQADKAKTRVETNATRAFDNVTKKTETLAPIDLTKSEIDLHLIDHYGDCLLHLADGASIRLRGSPEFSRWVVWTLAGKDFVCVEPWTCPGNALNTGESILELAPAQSRNLWVEYSLAPSR